MRNVPPSGFHFSSQQNCVPIRGAASSSFVKGGGSPGKEKNMHLSEATVLVVSGGGERVKMCWL